MGGPSLSLSANYWYVFHSWRPRRLETLLLGGSVLKMYHLEAHAGDAAFWEKTWDDGQLDEALRFCDIDPLRPLFERHAPPGVRMLEGGCGRGQYVLYYGTRGVNVVGIDFAARTLSRLKARTASVRVSVADVSALPFGDRSFDAYYSGGVVEHFEGGPRAALQEAARVLDDSGTLLVSVPYLSALRRLSCWWRRDRVLVRGTREAPPLQGPTFWQYAFGRAGVQPDSGEHRLSSHRGDALCAALRSLRPSLRWGHDGPSRAEGGRGP